MFPFFVALIMDTAEEKRACIKFCVKNGKTGAETLHMLRMPSVMIV
jgi:hypothetical protein